MIEEELFKLINKIQRRGCEWQTTEVKSAHGGCPEKLYDTISAFANQDDGGVLLFGIDESQKFAKVGVYDAQDLQKKVGEYCAQMTPVIRPVFTVCDEDGKVFVSAEIPPLDIAERPCFKTAKGRLKGAYVRVGDSDIPMTEYEVYSYEAYRKKYRDDIRHAEGALFNMLEKNKLDVYLALLRAQRPNLSLLTEEQQLELSGLTKNGGVTMVAWLLFSLFPQALYPRLCVSATRVPGNEMGQVDMLGNRFMDTKRIEGTLPEILDKAQDFVRNNMRKATRIDAVTGRRIDVYQYPLIAVREAILNALIHRDYSIHTENKPIQLNMYENRLEIINPGGLYGRLTLNQLGYTQPDTRNPVLVTAMEILDKTENRYSGIPTIRYAMAQHGLPEPVFDSTGGEFKVILYQAQESAKALPPGQDATKEPHAGQLSEFCRIPRTRKEIMEFLKVTTWQYAYRRYVYPLVENGTLRLTIPHEPRSRKQNYVTVESE